MVVTKNNNGDLWKRPNQEQVNKLIYEENKLDIDNILRKRKDRITNEAGSCFGYCW